MEFQSYYQRIATPFEWKFTREDLAQLLAKLSKYNPMPQKAVA